MEFSTLMQTRRAVNFFDPARNVTEDELRRMVELAALVPSSFNLQPWSLIAVRSTANRAKLRRMAMDQPKVTDAPVVLIVLADREGYKEGNLTLERVWQGMENNGYMKPEQKAWFISAAETLYGGTQERSLAFAVKNTAFFGMALMLAARDMGLDTHPMDGFDHEAVLREFDIPARYFVPLLICVGHFDGRKTLLPRNWRKSYSDIVISTI